MASFGQVRNGDALKLSDLGAWLNEQDGNVGVNTDQNRLAQILQQGRSAPSAAIYDINGPLSFAVNNGGVVPQTGNFDQFVADRNKYYDELPAKNAALAQTNAATEHMRMQTKLLDQPNLQRIDTENGPMVFDPKTGTLSPVKMEPGAVSGQLGMSNKPLTEAQGKATGFATRGRASSDIVENIGQGGKIQPSLLKRGAETIPVIGEGLGMIANKFQSPEQQQVEQAQRDFVNAVLRQESGAAINESEFANARKQYFPQPNDSPQVVEQKHQNRETAIKAFEIQSGPGVQRMQRMQQQQPQQPQQQRAAPSSVDYQETMFNAKKAIARNPAAREAILQKMQSAGYDTRGL